MNMDGVFGLDVLQRRMLDTHGRIVEMQSQPQTFISWSRIYRGLRDLLPNERFHRGSSFVHCELLRDSVNAIFADGSVITSDILVGADGAHSAVRRQFAPTLTPNYIGCVAWRGLVSEMALSPSCISDILPYFAFCLPSDEYFVGHPVLESKNETGPRRHHYNFAWYRPINESKLRRMLTDAAGISHSFSIPTRLVRSDVVDDMRQAAEMILAPQFAEVVRRCSDPYFEPIYEVVSERLVFGRVVLLGDAAFTARPYIGVGVTKAAGDAVALADALSSENTEKALLAYEAARMPIGRAIVTRARQLAGYLQIGSGDKGEAFLMEFRRRADAVLRITASIEFLRINPPPPIKRT